MPTGPGCNLKGGQAATQAIGECQFKQNRVYRSRYSFSWTWLGISFPEMVKWMFEIGTNLWEESFHLTLSTVSERLICVCSSSARSSSVTNFWHRRRFGRCSMRCVILGLCLLGAPT